MGNQEREKYNFCVVKLGDYRAESSEGLVTAMSRNMTRAVTDAEKLHAKDQVEYALASGAISGEQANNLVVTVLGMYGDRPLTMPGPYY